MFLKNVDDVEEKDAHFSTPRPAASSVETERGDLAAKNKLKELGVWVKWPYLCPYMKTTVELDDAKLESIMKAMGFKTRKEAIDWALTEGERLAIMHHIKANPWSADTLREGVDPNYDVLALRRAARMGAE